MFLATDLKRMCINNNMKMKRPLFKFFDFFAKADKSLLNFWSISLTRWFLYFFFSFDNLFDALHKGNNKITELRTILQRESQNS